MIEFLINHQYIISGIFGMLIGVGFWKLSQQVARHEITKLIGDIEPGSRKIQLFCDESGNLDVWERCYNPEGQEMYYRGSVKLERPDLH